MKKISIIGCGNMGEAILKGTLEKRLFSKADVIISDNRSLRRSYIRKKYRVSALSNKEAVERSNIVVIATKPQDIGKALKGLAGLLKERLVISIAAGIRIDYIKKITGAKRIIRAMPNTPALIGCGITAISAAPGVDTADIKIAQKIFSSIGSVVRVDERHMDAVTVVSGSGPAYFFLLIEAMIKSALSLGIRKDIAEKLVMETAHGAASLHKKTGICPEELRFRVTSKGGTTEAAIEVFKACGFYDIVKKALGRAHKRAKELSG